MGHLVIACYRPKPGCEDGLLACVRDHLPILRGEGLVTDRAPIVGRAADGTLVEMFEWRSQAAVDAAHRNPAVLALWDRFNAVCEYTSLSTLAECAEMFPHFEPVEV